MYSRERQGTWETRRDGQGSKEPESKRRRGMHNPPAGPGRESDLPIVVMKRGNARGAKGQDFDRVSTKRGRTAWTKNVPLRKRKGAGLRPGPHHLPLAVGAVLQGQAGATGAVSASTDHRCLRQWEARGWSPCMNEPSTPCECLAARDHRRAGCGRTARPVRRGGAASGEATSDT